MRLKTIVCLAVVAMLAACGGSGGGSSSGATSTTLTGVAAVGAPMAGATITITDANGTTLNTTAGDDGRYSINVANLVAPFVVTASGAIGDGQTTQVAVVATAPTMGSTTTANINPLTNAISSKLSSTSDPANLATNISTEKLNITQSLISNTSSFLGQALSALASSAGAASDFNPITDVTFAANGTGLDKLFDNLEMQSMPGTGVNIFVKDAVTTDDMAVSMTLPTPLSPSLNTSTVSLGTNTNLSSVPSLASMTVRDYTIAKDTLACKPTTTPGIKSANLGLL